MNWSDKIVIWRQILVSGLDKIENKSKNRTNYEHNITIESPN